MRRFRAQGNGCPAWKSATPQKKHPFYLAAVTGCGFSCGTIHIRAGGQNWGFRSDIPASDAQKFVDWCNRKAEEFYSEKTTPNQRLKDAGHLSWIYARLTIIHGENHNTDYMRELKAIVQRMEK